MNRLLDPIGDLGIKSNMEYSSLMNSLSEVIKGYKGQNHHGKQYIFP